MFVLDPRLAADSDLAIDLPLCAVRLAKNAAWPWLILIPRRADMADLIDLSADDQAQFNRELAAVSQFWRDYTKAYKLNVAALGNVVRQLHIHVVARYEGDPAWPAPIWGSGHTQPRTDNDRDSLIKDIHLALS